MAKLVINNKEYALKFGYAAFKQLGEAWGCKGPQAVSKKFQQLFPQSEGAQADEVDIPFENLDKIGDLALASMVAFTDKLPARDEVVEALVFGEGDQLQVLMSAVQESFPQSGNPEPRQKAGKKAARQKK